MPNFVHLHLHTEYSIIDGLTRIDELVHACQKANMQAVAVTDQNNLFGLIKFYKAARACGIKPIIGSDIWLNDQEERRCGAQPQHSSQHPFKITLLAQNDLGYKNIIQLISRAYLEGQKLGLPIVERAWLEELSDGIIALSGARLGDVGKALLKQDDALADSLLTWWQKFFPNRFYLELVRTGRKDEEDYIYKAVEAADKYDLPLVATNDVCFLNSNDFEAHEARVCINAGFVLEDKNRPRLYSEQQYLRTPDEMMELFSDIPDAIANTVEIAKRCNVELTLGKNFLPIYPVPQNVSVDKYLEEEAKRGLELRFSNKKNENEEKSAEDFAKQYAEYQARLQYELSVINQKGFPSYFLIVADFIRWAKKNGVPVGPGRGSGAGSLVAYALFITDVDPIKHDLLFERFLNPERVSLPDFDVDFCMEGRDRVIEYVVEHYGKDKVAQIITYGTMAARAAVRDVGRVLGFPYGFVDKIAKLIPFELGISLDKALEDEELLRKRYREEEEVKTLIDLAKKLEGIVRNAGKHAGGVVIAPSKLIDFMPLYCEEGEQSANAVTQFDKDDVEAVGLVKFDFLGLRTLTIINWALQNINAKQAKQNQENQENQKNQENQDFSPSLLDSLLDISTIPLDDKATYKLLQDCKTTAVFQLESRGMREIVKRLKPDCFNDIVALVALYRPGPLQSGMVDDFINRKHGRELVTYLHAALKPILHATYGVILYQEQVMQIAQVLAGYSLGSAEILRRAMGKKKPEEMANQRAIFLAGAVEKKIDKHVANTIFDLMEKFAGYGFNKSHSVAYALIAYQTAWLKAHYAAEFMAAVLSSDMDNTDKVVLFINECKNLGLSVDAPNINVGEYQFTVKDGEDNKAIIYGLGAIKGVGQAAIESVLESRARDGAFRDLFDFCKRVDMRKANKRVMEALICAGAFDKIAPNRATLFKSLPLALRYAEQEARHNLTGQLNLFSLLEDEEGQGANGSGMNYEMADEWQEEEKLKKEKSVLGFYLSGHLITPYLDEIKKIATCSIADLTADANKTVKIAGFVAAIKVFNTRNGNRLAAVTLEDHTGNIELTVFSDLYADTRAYLQEGQLLVAEAQIGMDSFTGSERAKAISIRTLENARIACAKCLLLKLEENEMQGAKEGERESDDWSDNLKQILKMHRGSCPIYISYTSCASFVAARTETAKGENAQSSVNSMNSMNAMKKIRANLKLDNTWQIQPTDELLQKLRQLLGKDRVLMYYN